ncbi:hypothetical protein ACCS85_27585 [Rhizobium ruizarguesonis]
MARANKKHEYSYNGHDGLEDFPQEAYSYSDDVTAEGVDAMRKRAKKVIDAEEWVVVDGIGPNIPA